MKQTTIRCMSVGVSICAILLSGCAGTVGVSPEQRVLNDYSQVAQARSSANDSLAQGTMSQEDWRITTNRIDAAAASLGSSMAAMNRQSMNEAEVALAASETLLGESVHAAK